VTYRLPRFCLCRCSSLCFVSPKSNGTRSRLRSFVLCRCLSLCSVSPKSNGTRSRLRSFVLYRCLSLCSVSPKSNGTRSRLRSFVCHSAAKRRNLLLPLPQLFSEKRICFCLLHLHFSPPKTTQKSHVKSRNQLTYYASITSALKFSYPQSAILNNIDRKNKVAPATSGANLFRKNILEATPLL
jgi:hypothetical protein